MDAFYDRLRLRNTADDVPSVGVEYIQPVQGVGTASWRRRLRLGVVGGAKCHRDHADQRTSEK